MGKQTGRNIEIVNSFELVIQSCENDMKKIDQEFFSTKLSQFNTVFPEFDLLGWYATTPTVNQREAELHQFMTSSNDSLLFLQFSPSIHSKQDLPFYIYECVIEAVDSPPKYLFVNVPYKIETGEVERIAVDELTRSAHVDSQSGRESSTCQYFNNQQVAVSMLHQRLTTLSKYLIAIQNGQLPKDISLLRKISSFCNLFPVSNCENLRTQYFHECHDSLLMTYLSSIALSLNALTLMRSKVDRLYLR
eukprot:Sdes_comp20774_c0_seq2m16816